MSRITTPPRGAGNKKHSPRNSRGGFACEAGKWSASQSNQIQKNDMKKHEWIEEIHPEIIELISLANECLKESIEHERGQLGMGADWQCQVVIERLAKLKRENPGLEGWHLVQAIIDQI